MADAAWRAGWIAKTGGQRLAAALACALAIGTTLAPTATAFAQAASAPSPAAPAPSANARYFFKSTPQRAVNAVGSAVLTAEERAFIAQLPEVRVGLALPAFQPYEMVAANGEVSGIHVEMLRQLAHTFGFSLRPVVFDKFSAALEAAERREVDVLMSLGVNAARSRYLEFTLGATPMVSAMFRHVGASAPGQAAKPGVKPEHARFAIERTNIANDFVRRHYPDATIIGVDDRGQALRALAAGQADYYVGNLLPTMDALGREPVPGIQVDQLVDYGTGYYHFGVRKDWALLARILNKGIGTQRHELPDGLTQALDQALANLPVRQVPKPRKQLSPEQWTLLLERPVWRVGAVRGLTALNEVDAAGRHQGIAAEYTEWIARHLGVGVWLQPFDSVAQMLDAARQGTIDVVPFLTRTEQRAAELAFSKPYVELPYVIVAHRDAPLYWDLGSLRGKTLALAAQHPLRETLAKRWPDIRILEVPSGQGAMDAVARGAADAAVEVKLFANLRIHTDASDSLRVLGEVADLPAQFHLATSRQAAELLPLINESLAEMPEEERTRMLRRWVAVDLPPTFNWRRHLPVISVSLAAVLALLGSGAWWMWRLRREVRSRRESEAQLLAVGAALPCVAFRTVVDGQGRVLRNYYSSGSEQVLGRALNPQLGIIDNLAPYVREQDVSAAKAAREAALTRGEPARLTVQYRHADGRLRWLHSEVVATRLDEPGQTTETAVTGYVADVTAELELQARVARDAQARHLLLASASHELRAPTHTLSLALQAIAQGTGDAAAHLQLARQATHTLGELITDVLDAARLDQGQLQLRPQSVELRQVFEQAANATRGWAREKGLAFEMALDGALPARVWIDPLRLQQVLTNLLSNAVKYTRHGQVRLLADAATAPDGSSLPWLQLQVQDSGIGISAERLERLFTPYAAAADTPADQPAAPQGSSGLGLSISQRLVGLMGGQLSLASQPGQGTQVTVRLPLPPPPDPVVAPPGAQTAPARAGASGARLLVCDDDATSRMLLTLMLKAQGFAVEEAAHAVAALERWRQGGIDAIVTDLDMPGMPGSELVTHIRLAEATRAPGGEAVRTVLVMCSGDGSAGHSSRASADAWFVKPVDVTALVARLRQLGVAP